MNIRSAALGALLSIAALSACGELDFMNRQARYVPYGESRFFEDGRAMRPLVSGTVAMEWLNQPGARGQGSAALAASDEIPIALDLASLERGRKHFEIFCATCHGLLADGDSIVARNMALRPPPSLLELTDRPAGYLFRVASEGFGLMPGYAVQLSPTERWEVVAYLQVLQRSQAMPLEAAPEPVRQELLRGAAQ